MSRIDRVTMSGSPFRIKAPPCAPLCRPTTPAISRLRRASRTAARLTPSFRANSRSGGNLSPGRSDPAAISLRTCSQISSNTRLVRIGANRGCERSFADASTALAEGRRAAGSFFARTGVVAAVVVFLVTLLFTPANARLSGALILYTNPAGMDSRTGRLDGQGLKCIIGLSNGRRVAFGHRRLGQRSDPVVRSRRDSIFARVLD